MTVQGGERRTARILVVDDDPRVRDLLSRYLEGEGFDVESVEHGDAMRRHLSGKPVDLVMLDLNLPGEDGLSLARELRATSDIAIIMITGKGDPIDRIVGLEIGADDYIPKPFELREVLARIRAVLRRATGRPAEVPAAGTSTSPGCLGFAGWHFDPAKRELRNPDGQIVSLSTGEFDLLATFLQHPTSVLNRDQLLDLVHGRGWTPFDRSIDTQVGRLRKKIERDPSNPDLIKTVRGVGYVFSAKVECL
ncbi:MAG: response regulator [Geminicoccaceae bacterium]